jgi:hypothetical protein
MWDSMVFCIMYPKMMSRISVGNRSKSPKVGGVSPLILAVDEAS